MSVTVPLPPTMKRPCVVLESVYTIHNPQEDASKDEKENQLNDQSGETRTQAKEVYGA